MNHSYSNLAKVILDSWFTEQYLLCTFEWWPIPILIHDLYFFSANANTFWENAVILRKQENPISVKAQCQDYFCTLEHNTFFASKDSPVKEPTFTNYLRFRLNIKCYNLSSTPAHSHYHCCCLNGMNKPYIWTQSYWKEWLKGIFK